LKVEDPLLECREDKLGQARHLLLQLALHRLLVRKIHCAELGLLLFERDAKVAHTLTEERIGRLEVPLKAVEDDGATGPGLGGEDGRVEAIVGGSVAAVTGDGSVDGLRWARVRSESAASEGQEPVLTMRTWFASWSTIDLESLD
jgi:hypothetical protein